MLGKATIQGSTCRTGPFPLRSINLTPGSSHPKVSGATNHPHFSVTHRGNMSMHSASRTTMYESSDADAFSGNLIPLKVAVYSASDYVQDFLETPFSNAFQRFIFIDARLNETTAALAKGYDAVCIFVNDECNAAVIQKLAKLGVKFIALRCAGFDRVDLAAAKAEGLRVMRVPTYSPRSVAEMALALMMSISRNLSLAHEKVKVGNYEASGLVGAEVSHKTYGIVGTGNIGIELIKLLKGFEGRVLAYDVRENPEAIALGAIYVDLDTLLAESDYVSLHVPLLPSTYHLMSTDKLKLMKQNAYLINVSRGGLIDTEALINMLEHGDDGVAATGGKLAGVALDVYELEDSLFFQDFTNLPARERMKAWDRNFNELKNLPQVLVTPHVAFLTHEALANIANTTVENLKAAHFGLELKNEVLPKE